MQQFGLNEKSQGIFKAKLANITCVCVCALAIHQYFRHYNVFVRLQSSCPFPQCTGIRSPGASSRI